MPDHDWNPYGYDYDIYSIQQYDGYAFSNNGQPTITLVSNGQPVPHNTQISQGDYAQINALYCGGPHGDYDPNCKDDNTDCAYWASIGECQINPGHYHFKIVKFSIQKFRIYVALLQKKLWSLLAIQFQTNF